MINSGDKKLIFLLESILLILPISLIFSNLISEILIFLIIVIFFTQVKKDEIQKILNNKIFIFLFLITLYLTINYFLNISKESSFTRSILFIRFPLYVISLSYFLNKNYINKKKVFLFGVL
jgi:drug/metabolite transporter (DMT)-like permease